MEYRPNQAAGLRAPGTDDGARRSRSAGHRSLLGRAGARRRRDRTGLEAPRRARPGLTEPGHRPDPTATAGSCRRPRGPCHRLDGPSPAPPPGTPSVLAGEARSQGGGGGRDQAQGPSRQGPQGQGNGPEGERTDQLYRSPDPGRQCPCGCPRPVVLNRRPRGPIRGCSRVGPHHYAPGGRPCPQRDETHRGCPRRAPGASRGTARENRGPWRAWEAGCRCGPGPRSPGSTPGRTRRRRRRTRGGCQRGVCSVATTTTGGALHPQGGGAPSFCFAAGQARARRYRRLTSSRARITRSWLFQSRPS